MRSLAEMENVRERARRDADNAKQFAIQGFSKNLLEVADVLRLAIEAAPADVVAANAQLKSVMEGVQATERILLRVLGDHGVKSFNPMGDKFDPNLHNALFEADDPSKDPGTVCVVTKIGYRLHERILRPASVGVVRSR